MEETRKLKNEITSGPSSYQCYLSSKLGWALEALSVLMMSTLIYLCVSFLRVQVTWSASELFWNLFLVNIITILSFYIGQWLMDNICLSLGWELIHHIRLQLTGSLLQFIWGFLQNGKPYHGSRCKNQPRTDRGKDCIKLT